VRIRGIRLEFLGEAPTRFRAESGGVVLKPVGTARGTAVEWPAWSIHAMLVAEYYTGATPIVPFTPVLANFPGP
jgi:hypothetical protein